VVVLPQAGVSSLAIAEDLNAMRKRRILFLTVIPSPYQRQLFDRLSKAQVFDVRVMYYAIGAHDRQWKHPELAAFESVMPGRQLRLLGSTAYYNPRVLRSLFDAQADIVVVSDYSAPTAQIAMRALGLRGNSWIFWGELPGFNQRGPIGSFMRRRLQAPLASSAAIAAIGSKAVTAYEELFPGKTVFNIPYFCDLAPYEEARRRRLVPEDAAVNILFSGQLIERKGCDLLLKAFAEVASRYPRARLIMLGSGPERTVLEGMVPDALRDRVIFLGHREPHEIPDIFAAAHVFCLPSRHDGWGVVINEAIGAGLPVVVSEAVGAGHDLVRDGVNGYLIRTGDHEQLAEALGRIVGDVQLRERLAAASGGMARNWGLDEGVTRWLSAADTVLAQGRVA
jgi:glycosyltransferase involved in cell wall biosynthesis